MRSSVRPGPVLTDASATSAKEHLSGGRRAAGSLALGCSTGPRRWEVPAIADITLTTVTRTQGANLALKEGAISLPGYVLRFEEVPVLVHGFRRMVRDLAFDVCEMAITTYLCAREHGVAFTAIPVFLVRGFHHDAIVVNTDAKIATPRSLEGRTVGVNRGYTVTTGVWARAILQEEHGVDLRAVTWARSGDEHVASYEPPANVIDLDGVRPLEDLVATGTLPAAVGMPMDHPNVAPLIPDPFEAGFRSLATRGFYPINHLVVVRDDVLAADPGLAVALFEAFSEAKAAYVRGLRMRPVDPEVADERLHLRVMQVMDDPLPYGVKPNRRMIDELIRHAVTQGILREAPEPEDVFHEETRELVG